MSTADIIDDETIELSENLTTALESCRRLVANPKTDKLAMFERGATDVFRAVTPENDGPWQVALKNLYEIGAGIGLDDPAANKILDIALDKSFELPGADVTPLQAWERNDTPKVSHVNGSAAPSIITDDDLRKFFAGWRAKITGAVNREKAWADCAADVAARVRGSEIGRAVAGDQLDDLIRNLDLFGLDDERPDDRDNAIQSRIAAALGTVTAKDNRGASLPMPEPTPALLSKSQFLAGYTPPDWFWDGIMQRRFVYSITAKTGHGKTAVFLLIAEKAASRDRRDTTLGGHQVDEGNVIYFAGENPDDLRNRMIASDHLSGRDCSEDRISIIPGTFSIEAMRAECEAKIKTLPGGKVDFIVVDTSAAYFLGDDENNNPQMGAHARKLRTLTTLPGGPCVGVLCHPVKNANEQSALLPRGGGAFIAEVDGNLTLWLTDDVTELWHTGKLRGPGFEPISFRLERVLCEALVDTKDRMSPTVRAVAITDTDKDDLARTVRSAEDTMLIAILEQPRPIAGLATACGWTSSSGEPHKSKAHRILKGLEKSGLVRLHRGAYELTDRGDKAAKAAVRTSAAQ
jgi:hypothetical protein